MNTLFRFTTALIVTLLGLIAGGCLLWYLSYGVDAEPPESVTLAPLRSPAEIDWHSRSTVLIRAQQEADAMVALGFAHGWGRAWSIALWRQAASGRLAEWFGEPAVELDLFTRRLGLAAQAEAAYDALDADAQAMLRAYADGVSAALQRPDIRLRKEFVALELVPEPWLPWHTLAVERLMAWLAATPPGPEALAEGGPGVAAFFEADQTLRSWLSLHGFENGITWAMQDSTGTWLFQRHVYGASALPFLMEVGLEVGGRPPLWGASLPGTPFFPAGQGDQSSWSLLLTSTYTLAPMAWDSARVTLDYQRLLSRDGAERLAVFSRLPDGLPLQEPPLDAPKDTVDTGQGTVWAIQWRGLTPVSDATAWAALRTGTPAPFQLLDGRGLWLHRDGTWEVLGTAPALPLPTGVFVGSTTWSMYAAELLRTQAPREVNLQTLINDAYSTWAAQMAPPLVNALEAQPAPSPAYEEAVTYLRNWDFAYDRASIAASIFDTWMETFEASHGHLPGPAGTDSTAHGVFQQTLAQAVDSLVAHFGADLSQWRWEHVQPDRRYFPIWSVEALRDRLPAALVATRYAPIERPRQGHPSTLAWGPSPAQRGLPAPSAWEAWVHTGTWDALTVRRRILDPNALFGRYLVGDRPPDPLRLSPALSVQQTTRLIPTAPGS